MSSHPSNTPSPNTSAAEDEPLTRIQLDVQVACAPLPRWPGEAAFSNIAECVAVELGETRQPSLCVRIVDDAEIQALNAQYRDKNMPTNVLSFAGFAPDSIDLVMLGDIVICANIVEKEAAEQAKNIDAHWAHMLVHGMLHLYDYDHIEDQQAEQMESLEIKILQQLGFENPYQR